MSNFSDVEDWENAGEELADSISSLNVSKFNEKSQARDSGRTQSIAPPSSQDGGSYSSPVSLVTAQVAGPGKDKDSSMDPVLIACLENPRERMTLLQFEDRIVKFFRNQKETQLQFPPLSSYHRLIVHRLAQRCNLHHQALDSNPYEWEGGMRGITLYKTAESFLPSVLFIDLSAERQQLQQVNNPPKIMIKRRGSKNSSNRNSGNYSKSQGNSDNKQQRNLSDREKAYAEARARIFGSSEESTSKENSEIKVASKLVNTQAEGPDGTTGFGRGRGKVIKNRTNNSLSTEKQVFKTQQNVSNISDEVYEEASSRNTKENSQDSRNWKESKAVIRNREEELNDPDFTRNYDAYRPSFTPYRMVDGPPRGPMVGYGHGYPPPPMNPQHPSYPLHPSECYDPPQRYYNAPPIPGYRSGVDYRSDGYSREDYRQPHSDYYRMQQYPFQHPGHGGRGYQYDALRNSGRSGRGMPMNASRNSLPGRHSPTYRPSDSYNEEFPPLG